MPANQVRLKMAARTLPQLPAIYQRGNRNGKDIAKELGVSVPDWAHVRKYRAVGSAHRRLLSEPLIEKVGALGTEVASLWKRSVAAAVCNQLLPPITRRFQAAAKCPQGAG